MRLIRHTMNMKRIILLFIIVLIITACGWLLKGRLLYHYDVWRMAHTVEEREIIKYNEKIQALRDKAGDSCFVNTYNDTTKPNRVRRAAATGLMKSDVTLAETLFKQHLDSTNPEVSGMAIRDLGAIKSRRYKNEILHCRNSVNEIVRWSVVDYLGNFQDAESIGILKSIRDSDKSEMVKNAATDRLIKLLKQAAK